MRSLINIAWIITLSACAVSRTTVHDVNKGSQAVATVGSSLINTEPHLPHLKVKLDLSGQLFYNANCVVNPRNLVVEIYHLGSTKSLYTTSIREDLRYSFDVGLVLEGDFVVKLLNSQTSKIIQEKRVAVNSRNDRLKVDFQACQ